MIVLLGALIAWSQEPQPADEAPEALAAIPDIVEVLGRGLSVDWSNQTVRVQAGSYGLRTGSTKAVEQSARLAVDELLASELVGVMVAPGLDVGALLDDAELGRAVASRQPRWRVAEATYSASGKVDLAAELSLQELLKPWTLARALPKPSMPPEGAFTGLVVDARGVRVDPVFAPRIQGPDQQDLWSGQLWDADAVSTTPCVWIGDEGHGAFARAGDRPLRIRALDGSDGVLAVDAEAASAIRSLHNTAALGQGRVVVVVDPR
jgi:hypothetical protein